MAAGKREDDHRLEPGGLSRRGFLTTLGVAGCALAGAGAAAGAPRVMPRENAGVAARLHRSNAELTLSKPPALQTLSRGGPRLQWEAPPQPTMGEPPLPSTRRRLLDAIFTAQDGPDPADFGLSCAQDGSWNHSAPLTQVMSGDPPAGNFAEGVTLTPAGCLDGSGEPWEGPRPMGYGSFQSWVSHDIFGEKLCLVTVEHPMPGSFLGIFLNTPGSPQTKLTYALELSMEPYDALFRTYIATSGLPGVSYEAAEVGFWPTSEGTQLALVELRGTDGAQGWGHTLSFHRGQASVGMTYFNWLNLVPL